MAQAGFCLDGLQMLQSRENQIGHLIPYVNQVALIGDAGQHASVFSDHPQSELTSNFSGSRKRRRDEPFPLVASCFPTIPAFVPGADGATSTAADGLPVTCEWRLLAFNSAETSTSGRPATAVSSHCAPAPNPFAQQLLSHISHQNLEMDAIIRLQNERFRLAIAEAWKRHMKSLLAILEQQVAKRLREMETELQNANLRNAELEENVRQVMAENQLWHNLAKNNEAVVSNLRDSLEQVLLQNTAAAVQLPAREGYGDNEATPFPADDAQSCCFEDEEPRRAPRMACKICRGNDVCVLVLPCRHLCLCTDCETKVCMCPICNHPMNARLRIFMS